MVEAGPFYQTVTNTMANTEMDVVMAPACTSFLMAPDTLDNIVAVCPANEYRLN